MVKKETEETRKERLPKLYAGMRMEALTFENQLIFMARVELQGDAGSPELVLTEESGQNVPWVEYNTKVKLRGFQQDGIPFSLIGYICGSSDKLWKVDRLEALGTEELRRFYRQAVQVQASVMCVNEIFAAKDTRGRGPIGRVPCKIMDLSGGGVRIRCRRDAEFQVDDWLFLSAENPVREGEYLNYTCCVRRVSMGKEFNEYGCEFTGLTETERETLLRTVMVYQQRELRARRKMDTD